ncbi:hypothetical protein DPEC_G00099790 [Dallia pectoralis]|uniref:Uncharacterized protein n=1 Tax=Dallia pectoralis TaxID=75939 RepID=A0ACC2GWS5_DALPE|nr:hypothetical protein DPEC_G00099790 [Dallia pectoralis]
MQRSLLGQGSGPAQWPNISRTVEALFLELCQKHPAGKTVHGVRVNRWAAMLSDYRTIRTMVLGSPHLREQTRLQLFEVNQLTLTQWYNTRVTSMEKFTLHPGTGSMISAREGVGPFDPADDRAAPLTVPEPSTGTYQLPADQGGQAVQRGRGATYQPPLPRNSLPPPTWLLQTCPQPPLLCHPPLEDPLSPGPHFGGLERDLSPGRQSVSTSPTCAQNAASQKPRNMDTAPSKELVSVPLPQVDKLWLVGWT